MANLYIPSRYWRETTHQVITNYDSEKITLRMRSSVVGDFSDLDLTADECAELAAELAAAAAVLQHVTTQKTVTLNIDTTVSAL